jgi:hypothetical protein
MLVAKGIGAAARFNIRIGGYGSRLKAGTTRVLYLQIQFSPLSSSGLTGRSSTPWAVDFFLKRLWNTGSLAGACHRAARCADPVAGDDG